MKESYQEEIENASIEFIIIAAVAIAVISYYMIYLLSSNTQVSIFYTTSALFDAGNTNVDVAGFIPPMFSIKFYEMMAVLIIDGISKILVVSIAIAGVISILSRINIQSRINNRVAKHLKKHVIICGYSPLAERICNELEAAKIKFVVIDKDKEKIEMLSELGYIFIEGDFSRRDILKDAAIDKASIVLFATENDYMNILGILAVKSLGFNGKIISRTKDENTRTKMQRAGAYLCVVAEQLSGIEIGNAIIEK
ncbi:MAG: potassium channel family protein [Candidatus Micrarchaeia archaeon]